MELGLQHVLVSISKAVGSWARCLCFFPTLSCYIWTWYHFWAHSGRCGRDKFWFLFFLKKKGTLRRSEGSLFKGGPHPSVIYYTGLARSETAKMYMLNVTLQFQLLPNGWYYELTLSFSVPIDHKQWKYYPCAMSTSIERANPKLQLHILSPGGQNTDLTDGWGPPLNATKVYKYKSLKIYIW